MNSEKEVERKIEQYQELARENKSVDVAALMVNALDSARQDEVDAKKRSRAYWVSVGLPPFGLLYAVRYYFSDKAGGKRVALYCVILTAVSLLAAWAIGQMFLSSSAVDMQQLQSINPEELKSLFQ